MGEMRRDAKEGNLEEAGDRWRLRFERRLAYSPEKVWRALTEEEHLAAWFPTTIEGDCKAGAPLQFRFRGEDYPPTKGEMIVCDPPRALEFSWGEGWEGEERAEITRFELIAEGTGCLLIMTTTYDQVGKSARDAAGWHVCLDALERDLAGEAQPADGGDPWAPLNQMYAERFGPEAAAMGPPEPKPE